MQLLKIPADALDRCRRHVKAPRIGFKLTDANIQHVQLIAAALHLAALLPTLSARRSSPSCRTPCCL